MTSRHEPFWFSFETRLGATAETVWAHATSMEGVNRELFPLVHMTSPRSMASLDALAIVPGRRVFRSWILALGVFPVDYDDLTFVEFEAPRRFLERSPMLTQCLWEHERVVEPVPHGCVVRDTVRFEPRWRWLGHLHLLVFRLVFANRHRRLARLFAASGAGLGRAARAGSNGSRSARSGLRPGHRLRRELRKRLRRVAQLARVTARWHPVPANRPCRS